MSCSLPSLLSQVLGDHTYDVRNIFGPTFPHLMLIYTRMLPYYVRFRTSLPLPFTADVIYGWSLSRSRLRRSKVDLMHFVNVCRGRVVERRRRC